MKLNRLALHEAAHATMIAFFGLEITKITADEKGSVEYRSPNSPREEITNSYRSKMATYRDLMITSAGMIGECLFMGSQEFWRQSFPIEMSGDFKEIKELVRKEGMQSELKQILVQVSQILSLPMMTRYIVEIATELEKNKIIDHTPTTERGKKQSEAIRQEILYGTPNEFPEDEVPETLLSAMQERIIKDMRPVQLHGTASLTDQIIGSISEGIGD
jgi:hypothetical protein